MSVEQKIIELEKRISYLERAGSVDYTPWTDYSATSTVVGWSAFTTKEIYYKIVGKIVFVNFNISGTSNSTTTTFTLTKNAKKSSYGAFRVISNGVSQTIPGRAAISTSSSTVTLVLDWAGNSISSTGTKTCQGFLFFEIE